MTTLAPTPEVVHIGSADLPWVDIGMGSLMRVAQVIESEGIWVVENVFQKGYPVPRHRHTGQVWAFTQSGAWKYKEYDFANVAGSFLYEPANSVHTLEPLEDDTRVWFRITGANLDLDADDNVINVTDGRSALSAYLMLCEAQGKPTPKVHLG
jgi:quercetin dioxygenase-like cupin family protein